MSFPLILFADVDATGEPTAYSDEPTSGLSGRLVSVADGMRLERTKSAALLFVDSAGSRFTIDQAFAAGLLVDESARHQHVQDLVNQVAAHNAIWQHLIWHIVFIANEDIGRYELAETQDEVVLYRDRVEIGGVRHARWWAPLTQRHVRELAYSLSVGIPRG